MPIQPKNPAKFSEGETIDFIYDKENYRRKIKSVKAYGNKWYYEVEFEFNLDKSNDGFIIAKILMVPENKIEF